jgi:hypothetical protein
MPAPTAPVDICNIALDYFGERADITSIETPENSNEVILARHYDLTRQNLLREYIWNFSRAETTLARTGDGGLDYSDRFLMPSDCLRIISIGSVACQIRDYNILDREIYINPIFMQTTPTTNALQLRYVKDVTDVSKFDSLFTKLLGLQLAANISYKFSGKKTQSEMIMALLKAELPKAVSVNSQEKKPKRRDHSRAIEARSYPYSDFTATDPYDTFWISI